MQYKADVWNNGHWYVGDGKPTPWWVPCRILNLTPKHFVQFLILEFNAEVKYTGNLLLYSFRQQRDAERYKDYINKKAKNIVFELEGEC